MTIEKCTIAASQINKHVPLSLRANNRMMSRDHPIIYHIAIVGSASYRQISRRQCHFSVCSV